MSAGAEQRVVVEDLVGVVTLFSDGSVVRGDESPFFPPGPFPVAPGVHWKDAVYDAARGLKVRLYKPSPAAAAGEAKGNNNKLPVLVYFHGGGYCIGAYDQPMYHSFCQRIAAELPAVVLSVQYRLAPEHRLPAAIDDAATFFSWLRAQAVLGAEPWLAESADFSSTFVAGVSAGANLAHHAVVQITAGEENALGPLRLAGYVLLSAYFGSVERTAAELDPPSGVSLTVENSDQAWRMALPVGATRDHPLANPFAPGGATLEAVPMPPALVVAPGRDVLRDHVRGYAARHGFSVGSRSEATEELMAILKGFVHKHAALD
nr:unnamed protein product [Digitaria exilis]